MSVACFVSVTGAPVSHFTLIVNCIKQSGKSPPNQYCKALRTAMYKRYINSKLLIIKFQIPQLFLTPLLQIQPLRGFNQPANAGYVGVWRCGGFIPQRV